MKVDFLVWESAYQPGICSLMPVENVEDDFELTFGASRIAGWPGDALCRMSPRRKRDVGLADSLFGATSLVISGKLRRALEHEEVSDIEFLPIKIINHKGRVASDDYHICNPQRVIDCIDLARSRVTFSAIEPDTIMRCEGLVIREDAIPEGTKVFRLGRWLSTVLLRRDVAEKLVKEGLTGLCFTECRSFKG